MQPSMDLTLRLPELKANRKTVLIVKCFRETSLGVQKGNLSAGVEPGKGSKRGCPSSLGSVSVETIQEISEIFIAADINGQIPKLLTMAGL